jgi:hypothetical protein
LAIIAQNRWGASPKNGISLEGITIFLEKILANPSTAQREWLCGTSRINMLSPS